MHVMFTAICKCCSNTDSSIIKYAFSACPWLCVNIEWSML